MLMLIPMLMLSLSFSHFPLILPLYKPHTETLIELHHKDPCPTMSSQQVSTPISGQRLSKLASYSSHTPANSSCVLSSSIIPLPPSQPCPLCPPRHQIHTARALS